MTTAKPPARYSAMESARSGDFATPELHHPSGHDLLEPPASSRRGRHGAPHIPARRPFTFCLPLRPRCRGISPTQPHPACCMEFHLAGSDSMQRVVTLPLVASLAFFIALSLARGGRGTEPHF